MSASTLYGSRAANGVVLITTKAGTPGTSRLSYQVGYSNDEVNQLHPLNTMYGQGSGGLASAGSSSWGPLLSSEVPVFDHAEELYRNGNRLDQTLSWSGGSARTTFYLSLGWLNQDGVIKGNSAYERASVRFRGGHALRDDLKVSAGFSYTNSKADLIQQGSNVSGIQLGALRTPPDSITSPT